MKKCLAAKINPIGRVCRKCQLFKNASSFHKTKRCKYGLSSYCKNCSKIRKQKYYEKNKNKIREKENKKYNKILERNRRRKFAQKYPERIRERARKDREKHKLKRQKAAKEYKSKKIKSDALFKLSSNLRSRLRCFLKSKSWRKSSKFSEYIGCSGEELKSHLSKQFREGMTFENYGKWHIDHIVPLCSAQSEQDAINLCHYTNLQPLWAFENQSKSKKYEKRISG